MQLDHVFVLLPADPDADVRALEAAGLCADFGRAHPGQGTVNRCVFFESSYLELLQLADRAEARANALRLDRRADWRSSGAAPFGLCLRGALPEALDGRFLDYHPSWLAPGARIRVHRHDRDAPAAPLLFALDPPAGYALPRPELALHPCGARRILRVVLRGPAFEAYGLELPREVVIEEAPDFEAEIVLDGPRGLRVARGIWTLRGGRSGRRA